MWGRKIVSPSFFFVYAIYTYPAVVNGIIAQFRERRRGNNNGLVVVVAAKAAAATSASADRCPGGVERSLWSASERLRLVGCSLALLCTTAPFYQHCHSTVKERSRAAEQKRTGAQKVVHCFLLACVCWLCKWDASVEESC